MWSIVVLVGSASIEVDDIVPLLLVESDLEEGVLSSLDLWKSPGPLIDVQVVWVDLDILGDWLLGVWSDHSSPKSVIQMRSLQHVSETLMSLEVLTV